MKKMTTVLVLFLLFPVLLLPESASRFSKEALRKTGSYKTLFNLGGEAARMKEYGYAALFWSRAAVIHDGDSVLTRNLRSVRKMTGADRYSIGVPALVEILLFFFFYFSRATLYLLLTLIVAGLFVFLNVMVFRRLTGTPLFRIVLIGMGAVLLLLTVSLVLKNRQASNPERAILVRDRVPLRQHFGQDSILLLKLPAALEVTIREKREDSYRISLPGGGQGWIPAENIVPVNPG